MLMLFANILSASFLWAIAFEAIFHGEENLPATEDADEVDLLCCRAIVVFLAIVATFNVIRFWGCQ